MAEKIRYTRRDLKGPDEFISTFGRTVAWCKENRTKVAGGAIGILAVVALAFGARAYLQWEENKAVRDLWPHLNRAREVLLAPSAAPPDKVAALEQFLQENIAMHPNTRASVFARYYLGCIAFVRGNYDLSLAQFRDGIASGKDDGAMKHLFRQGLANSLEAKGDFAGAAAAYRDIEAFAGPEEKIQARLGEARVLSLAGKKTEAAALYRLILKESPETPMRDLVEVQLAHME